MTAVTDSERPSALEPARKVNATALTAAAMKLDPTDRALAAKVKLLRQDWQRHAWDFDETLSEIHYAHDYYGNTCSRVRLFAGYQVDPDDPPIALDDFDDADEDPEGSTPEITAAALDEMRRLDAGADGGLPAIAGDFAVNLALAGEGYLHGTLDETSLTGERFAVYSVDEFKPSDIGYAIHPRGATVGNPVQEADFVLRVWRRFRRFRDLADAPMRALLDDCDNLLLLKRVLYAASASRMHGGIMLVPSEWSFPQRATDPNAQGQAVDDPLNEQIMLGITTPLQDARSVASVAPTLIRGPADTLDKARWIDLGRGYGEEILKQIAEVRQGIAVGLDLPVEILTGMGDTNHWCTDEQTEVLTAEGWRAQDQITEGDEILTLNHDTGLSEWQPIEAIYRARVEDEPMIGMETKNHSSLTTHAHRWPTIRQRQRDGHVYLDREFVHTEDLTYAHSLTAGAPAADQPAEPKYADDLVELVGWYWTEGNDGGTLTIAQSHTRNPERVARIRAALLRLYGPRWDTLRGSNETPAWRESIQTNEHSHGGPITIFWLNRSAAASLREIAPDKRVRLDFIRALTPAQLRLFTDVSEMGDGQHYRQGRSDIWQRDGDMLDAYELALILSGRMVTRCEAQGGTRVNAWSNQTTLRPVKAHEAAGTANVEEQTYTGLIWCPTTANGTWCARRRGTVYFTGNSAWQIAEETFRAHIEPLVLVICRALTDGYLHPMLRARGLDPAGYMVGYDPSALIGHPDLYANVSLAHERYAASDEALRRAGGMSDDDAPDEDEIRQRIFIAQQLRVTERISDPNAQIAVEPESDLQGAGSGSSNTTPSNPADTTRSAPEEPALVAAGGRTRLDQLGPRLTQIDQDLRARVQTLADTALQRALERAGAMASRRLRGNQKGRSSMKAPDGVADVKLAELPRHLGREHLLSMGLTEDKLIDGELGELEPEYRKLTKRALAAALLAGRRAVPDDRLSDDRIQTEHRKQDDWIAGGFAILSAAVLSAAHEELFTPAAVPAGPGELDLSAHVSPSAVRESLAVAGGAQVAGEGFGAAPPGGVATGTIVMDAFRDALQILPQGWQWVYGYPDREFEPHANLEGQEFSSWEDEILANPDDFPDVPFYRPGDHLGCSCGFVPMFESDRPNDEEPPEESA